MFTPPPSPDPKRTRPPVEYVRSNSDDSGIFLSVPRSSSSPSPDPFGRPSTPPPFSYYTPTHPHDLTHDKLADTDANALVHAHIEKLHSKKLTGRRTLLAVVLIPALLIFIALSTQWLAHPAALDVLSQENGDWERWKVTVSDWTLHKRHPQPDPQALTPPPVSAPSIPASSFPPTLVLRSSSTPSSLPSASASGSASPSNTGVPTVPSTPPVLPTPFPQPLSTISQNFSTEECVSFFTNMTNQESFRSCRSFGMLLQSSDEFMQAQKNLTLLNTIVWGTCNTDPTEAQCISNMNGFVAELQRACATELAQQNSLVEDTMIGLQAYDVMRQAGCLTDNGTTSSTSSSTHYCYLDAVASSIPSDQYFYTLPLGISFPNDTKLSCSACAARVMKTFVQFGNDLAALGETYGPAAQLVDASCGADYVPQGDFGEAQNAARSVKVGGRVWGSLATALAMMVFSVC